MEYIPAKTIVSGYQKSNPWFGINYNMNIYKGCCHGCIYCDSRSDCYRVEHFDVVRAKENALAVIRDDLQRKRKKGVVGTGAMSDPYNPFERELKLTRNTLELLNAYQFGVAIATKSDLITRDIPILQAIGQHSPVLCKLTVTTADDELSRKIEPGVCVSSARFAAVKALAEAGLYSGILLMPSLPFLTDNRENVLAIVEAAHQSRAKFIYAAFGMTLRGNQREYYYTQLDRLFPGLKEKYIRRYGNRYSCSSPKARELWNAFTCACKQCGMVYDMKDIILGYRLQAEKEQLLFL